MDGWTSVFKGPQIEADLVHAQLRAKGIRAEIVHRANARGFAAPSFADSDVLVQNVHAQEARRLVAPRRKPYVQSVYAPLAQTARRALGLAVIGMFILAIVVLLVTSQQ